MSWAGDVELGHEVLACQLHMQTPGLTLGKGWSWDRAASRTSCLLGAVGEERLRVRQEFAPNGGSAVSSVCAPQPLEGGEEGYSGRVNNFGDDRAGAATESFGAPGGFGQFRHAGTRMEGYGSVNDPGWFPIALWWEAGGCLVVSVVCSEQGSRRGTWVASFLFFDLHSQKE